MLNPTIPSGQTLKKLDTTYHHLGPHSYKLAYELHWLWLYVPSTTILELETNLPIILGPHIVAISRSTP